MKRIRVLLADDHRLFLGAIKVALDGVEDIEVVGAAESGAQVLPLIARTSPDLVLLDLRMPQFDGLALLDSIRQRRPGVKVAVLSGFSEPDLIEAAVKRGASAYILKSINPVDLPSVIRQVMEGTVYQALAFPERRGQETARASGLTEREAAILRGLARGLSNEAIAKELWVSQQTVKFHVRNIYRKLGVANRTEAARYAYQHGLVENPLYGLPSTAEAQGRRLSA